MGLSAHWKNKEIQPEKRRQAERIMEDFLLEHFGCSTLAYTEKVDFNQTDQKQTHPWNIAMVKGVQVATRGIQNCSNNDKGWEIKFFAD